MTMEIVRVDLHATGVRALVYPRDCATALIAIGGKYSDKRVKEQKLDEATRRALNGERSGHFVASWVGGKWLLKRRIKNQEW